MRVIPSLLVLAALGAGAAWWIARPKPFAASVVAGLEGDPGRGEAVFLATGCASCHMAPGANGEAELILAGGQRFPSDFGTFIAPNISQDRQQGIGGWSALDLANALKAGVSPGGQHYYPALPWASYAKLEFQEVVDLHAYLETLPADPTPSLPHEVGFPFDIRAGLGLWKALFLNQDWVVTGDLTEEELRGRHLAEAMAHCGECHTPRNGLGAMDRDRWLAGVPGDGGAPNITPAALDWSGEEIAYYLTSGFTPEYDSAGGHMAHVVENFARLPEEDALAVAAYLKRVPPVE